MKTKTNINDTYYIIERANNDNYPLLNAEEGEIYQNKKEYVEKPEPMVFGLGAPVPNKPLIVDYHSTPYSVVSQKIADVLSGLNIKGLQLIPATIVGKNNKLHKNYHYLNIYNLLPVLDKEKSVFIWFATQQLAKFVKKVSLDEDYLNKLPLAEKLVFRLSHNPTFALFHQSVVDTIMAVNPEGLRFTKVSEYGKGTYWN